MPRWLAVLIVLFAFVIPDPAGAGAAVGNAIDAIIVFFKSLGTAVTT